MFSSEIVLKLLCNLISAKIIHSHNSHKTITV